MPAPGFLTDAQLQTQLEAVLQVAPGSLSAGDAGHWLTIITAANASAYSDLQGTLLGRGLSATQVDTWGRGAEFQRDIGIFWCLVKGAAGHNYDDKFVKALDRRADLKTVALLDSDGDPLVPPDPPLEGQVARGEIVTSADLFRFDPYDRRRGRVTRW